MSLLLMFSLAGCGHKAEDHSSDDEWSDDEWGDEDGGDDEGEGETPSTYRPGSILGRVCHPNGRQWLSDAMAYANIIGKEGEITDIRTAYTDSDGYFLLDNMPSGAVYTVYIQYGDEILETHEVNVGNDEEVILDEPDCFNPLDLDVAIITGDYDDFEAVFSSLGFRDYTLIDGLYADETAGFLTDIDSMLAYDIIVFNGGHIEEGLIYPHLASEEEDEDEDIDADDTGLFEEEDTGGGLDDEDAPVFDVPETVIENVRNYVAAGGTIYVSDWAYDVVAQAWPEAINFVGADEIPNAAQLGESGLVNAVVSDGALAEWLATDTFAVSYDLPAWPPIEGVYDTVRVHLSGSVEYRLGTSIYSLAASPLLVSFSSGDGRVAFSTFRVAENSDSNIRLTLQYMLYSL